MATVDLTSGQRKASVGGLSTIINNVNFSLNNVSASDVVQVIKVGDGDTVLDFYAVVQTAEGATCTATAGDGTDPDGLDASIDLNASAGTVTRTTVGTDAYAVGREYSAADTIDLVMGHDTDAAILKVIALIANEQESTQKA